MRTYCAAVFLGGIAALVALHRSLDIGFAVRHPATFALLAAGVVLAETLPVRIPRRGEHEVITLSSSFVMALLLAGGLGPAILAQGVALAVPDLISRRPAWRIRFNLGQYTLSVIAAFLVLKGLGETAAVGTSHPFDGTQLPGVLLSAAVFFIVNTGLVGVAVALFQRVPVGRYFRSDFLFVLATAGVLLLLAPIVIATAAYSPLLMPLFAAPMLAIHQALKAGERSRHAARHDSLTSLPNRVAFQEGVENAIKDRAAPAGVLLMDLDRFKDVNDTLGHHHGDLLLQQVAERLLALELGGQIARLGGDEFAVLIADCSSEHAVSVANRVAASLRPPFQLEQVVVDVQASVGIAMFPDDGDEVQILLQKADVAMYRAKGTNRDIVLYNERDDDHSPSKLALSADLRAALEQKQIIAWYQPELDLRSGQVFAVEALVRWPHPSLGMLSPDSFIGMSETTSLIKPLTQLVLDVALRQLSAWDELGLLMKMAVNISTAVLIDKNFTASVVTALEQARVTPDRLKLEVTESTLMADPDTAMAILLELSQLGIEISIDDFGTGYSSLAYLAGLPASEVKIDRSFVARMGDSFKDSAIVSSTIDLAHHLGLRAVAEGVEDTPTLDRLRSLACDAVQGFGISRPRRAEDLTPWLLAEQAAIINATARSAA
ncbi:MAG TPA: EAL domain-containing protein [Solirubrobacteraceae bacterium]|nr:EAL domain-containing protein [Solirubrobacteraceae bacterium]